MAAPPADDYYALLGVDDGAGIEELRAAWRALAARWHPDRAGLGATHTFQRLSEAYRILSDPLARMAYDRRRRAAGAGGAPVPGETEMTTTPAGRAAGPPGKQAVRPPAPAVMLSRISRPIQILLACGAADYDEPGLITLVLSEAEATQGGMATIPMRVDVWCPQCAGRPPEANCRRCGGTRTVEELYAAWLAVPPGVAAGEVLAPSVDLPGMVEPVRFRIRLARPRKESAQ